MKLTRFQWYRAGLIFLLAVLIAAGLVLVRTTRQLTISLNSRSPMLETLSTIGRVRLLAREMEITRPGPGTLQDDPESVRYGNTVKNILAETAELANRRPAPRCSWSGPCCSRVWSGNISLRRTWINRSRQTVKRTSPGRNRPWPAR